MSANAFRLYVALFVGVVCFFLLIKLQFNRSIFHLKKAESMWITQFMVEAIQTVRQSNVMKY